MKPTQLKVKKRGNKMHSKKGKIITITSCKGGVGKSILTMNLAGVFSMMKLKVLVIDFDLFGGAIATYINSENEKTIYNLVEDITHNRYKDINSYIYNYNENISIISAPRNPKQAYKIDSKYIPLILNNVVYKYDVILIDTTHILNEINLMLLDNSDKKLFVLDNDIFALKNTKSFFSVIEEIGIKNIYTVLNNSVDPNKNYFTLYDIKNIIGKNIDFEIPKSMYIRGIDNYLMDGKILLLNKKITSKKDIDTFENIAKVLIEEGK